MNEFDYYDEFTNIVDEIKRSYSETYLECGDEPKNIVEYNKSQFKKERIQSAVTANANNKITLIKGTTVTGGNYKITKHSKFVNNGEKIN
jgi:hypothetical protein